MVSVIGCRAIGWLYCWLEDVWIAAWPIDHVRRVPCHRMLDTWSIVSGPCHCVQSTPCHGTMLRCSIKLINSHGIWIRNSKFRRHYWIPNNLTLWNKNFHVQHDDRPSSTDVVDDVLEELHDGAAADDAGAREVA
uniref:Replication factor A 1, rfa1, putative n=1 Tax=Arundo donax TaxID=35708 RepID=A0A0A9D7J9_ARUDO